MSDNATQNVEKNRNTIDQIEWYERRSKFIARTDANDLSNNFSVFATRQQITRFIETLRYWEMISDVPGNILQ